MDNAVALVTGGTGGIGTAVCRELEQQGFKVVAGCRDLDKGRVWQRAQREAGHDIELVALDVSDYESCFHAYISTEEVHGPVQVLVNAAGITRDKVLKKMTPDLWQQVIDTNLTGTFNMCRIAASCMAERGYGRIINISSVNGRKGQFGQVNYAASKAGIHGITMSLAQELARKGVTVNTLSPGYVMTEMVAKVPAEVLESITRQIPVGRLGTPEEIAHSVAFLAGRRSGFITGSDLSANGGMHMY
ncbi:acetoacetyl-CoA reductase [Ferrimonas sediminicola]|uniref:Acetoacetyl-CoA reductase n=1 Tax=Ferrimonas sediminicola TaxID=2569538 RepID=A0A4U1BN10_9GAMM|nr:acetoacetyl-CoA reductase [Ferrimonas sediminicola]TKB51508.1 acetoacetyl-CoA reductase [Ferrimonas sediminicola]